MRLQASRSLKKCPAVGGRAACALHCRNRPNLGDLCLKSLQVAWKVDVCLAPLFRSLACRRMFTTWECILHSPPVSVRSTFVFLLGKMSPLVSLVWSSSKESPPHGWFLNSPRFSLLVLFTSKPHHTRRRCVALDQAPPLEKVKQFRLWGSTLVPDKLQCSHILLCPFLSPSVGFLLCPRVP